MRSERTGRSHETALYILLAGGNLTQWVVVEGLGGHRYYRHLRQNTDYPNFDALAKVIAKWAPKHGLEAVLRRAREDCQSVQKTKVVIAFAAERN